MRMAVYLWSENNPVVASAMLVNVMDPEPGAAVTISARAVLRWVFMTSAR